MAELEVGKTYKTRDGKCNVTITRTLYSIIANPAYPYEGKDENGDYDCYTVDGLVWKDNITNGDLIITADLTNIQGMSAFHTIVDERTEEPDSEQCTCLCNDLYHQVALAYIKSAATSSFYGEQLTIQAHNTARDYLNVFNHRKEAGTLLLVPKPEHRGPWSLDA